MLQTTLPLALFLSSQGKARAYIADKGKREHYLCLVSVSPTEREQASPGDVTLQFFPSNSGSFSCFPAGKVTLQLFRVMYPHRQDGEGWGKPVPAPLPHRVIEQPTMRAMLDYLSFVGLAITTDTPMWEPIEDEPC
jgi:hypothetical protein